MLMSKRLICIECPKGCNLSVKVENNKVVAVDGHQCPKGNAYAVAEIEDPKRILTTTILTEGLQLKMLPVRTDAPIPKSAIFAAMAQARKLKWSNPVLVGEPVVENFLGLGVNLIATRGVGKT